MALTEEQATARAEAEVQGYCGWHIAPQLRETLTLDGDGSGVLFLPTLHLVELHSVSVNGTPVEDLEDVEWSTSGVLRCLPRTTRLRGVQVEVTHGYESWPVDVQAVVDRLAQRTTSDPGNLVQVGQVRVATAKDGLPLAGTITDVDRFTLDRYQLPPRP